jgi:hypothetical protein
MNGSNKVITPKNNASQILIEVTFESSIVGVSQVNAVGTFQIYDVTNATLVGSSYTVSAQDFAGGSGATAPASVRAFVSNAALTSRSFQMRGSTSNVSGAAGAQSMVWSITEIKT